MTPFRFAITFAVGCVLLALPCFRMAFAQDPASDGGVMDQGQLPDSVTVETVPAPDADGDAVTLTLRRDARIDQTTEIQKNVSESKLTTLSKDGSVFKKYSVKLSVKADLIVRIVDVNGKGEPVKSRVFVKSLAGVGYTGQGGNAVHCQGATVLVSLAPAVTITRSDKHPLTPADQTYLQLLFKPVKPTAPDTNALYAVNHPVKLGDSWAPSSDILAQYATDEAGFEVPSANLQGTVMFAREISWLADDVDVIDLSVTAESVPAPDRDGVLKDASATLTIEAEKMAPSDAGKALVGESLHTTLDITAVSNAPKTAGAQYKQHIDRDMSWRTVRVIK